jgi:hypothetical protein
MKRKDRLGLVTLADLPPLKGSGPTTSTIAIARLDDNLKDPRYGSFKITQSDFDGWSKNLADTFGGRVAIDADHSSDRGGGTRAMGWITGLHQDGKLVNADVEWTPRGAKAIRRGDYRHISPTFVERYRDEHGVNRGRALIGAGLTNRPVLRAGVPALSLSRDTFDGVATPRKRQKDGRTMSTTISRKEATRLRALSAPELAKVLPTLSPKSVGKLTRHTLAACDGVGLGTKPSVQPPANAETVMTLAEFAPAGVQYAGTVDWQPPSDANRVPLGLDDAGKALHGLIADRAASTGTHYFDAMADVTGIPAYRERSDIPPALGQQQGLNPDQAGKYSTARGLAVSAGISWMDALNYLAHLEELTEVQGDTGTASVPWLDSTPLPAPPRPWSEEDWARDQRRATAAGIVIGALGPDGQDLQLKALWQAGAEQGRDIVGEMAQEQRQDALAKLEDRGSGLLDQARAAEDNRRFSAIGDELNRRARNRVAGNGRPAARRLPGTLL